MPHSFVRFGVFLVATLVLAGLPYTSASAQITVRGRLAHDTPAMPGQEITGSILVDNETMDIQQARVYQTDYLFFADGTNAYNEPGTSARSNARWVSWSPQAVTVPPNGSVTISYRIAVPADADPGSYWSMLMVEAIDPESAESTLGDEPPADREVGFRQVTRYGVQVAVHVSETEALKEVAFEGVHLVATEDGRTLFQADIVNTGAAMIRPDVYMRVFDQEGKEYGPFNGVQFRLYPGTSVRQRIALEGIPPGTYQAILVVDGGDDAVFGGQYELTI